MEKPTAIDLIITRITKGNFIVQDVNGNIMFKIEDTTELVRQRRVLSDANGKPLFSLKEKIMSAHCRWDAYKGSSTSSNDLMFSAKISSLTQSGAKIDVFVASNTDEDTCDFKLYDVDSNTVITQMRTKTILATVNVLAEKNKTWVRVYENTNCAFMVALAVIKKEIYSDEDEYPTISDAFSLISLVGNVFGGM